MKSGYELIFPGIVYGGENSVDNLAEVIKENRFKNVALLSGRHVSKTELITIVENAIEAGGASYSLYTEIPTEPAYMAVQELVDSFKHKRHDFLVACGGGSVLDAAKLCSILMTDECTLKDMIDNPGGLKRKKDVPIALIPTTAGSGAEVTPNSIVAVPEKNLKVGIVNKNTMPEYVFLDARMVRNVPKDVAAAAGMDSLCHCIENLTSNKATPLSDIYCLEGMDLIMSNIEEAIDNPEAMEAKNRMQLGAFYGGLAITGAGVTGVHALSYPLGGKYHISHGVSNSMLLVPVMRFNAKDPEVSRRIAMAYDRCRRHKSGNIKTERDKVEWMLNEMDRLADYFHIPRKLSDFHIPKEDLDGLVEAGMEVTRLLVNNRVPISAEDARQIYLEIF
ncbi:MAG: iron-containing alcohol dehydrogenase [Clostridium sp.]|nr:iron-containing alcohol dehydrogenase [Clostridium sp.]